MFPNINLRYPAVDTWKLKLDKSTINIASSWNVNIEETDDSYIITPLDWNSRIEAGQFIEFGINGEGTIGDTVSYFFE